MCELQDYQREEQYKSLQTAVREADEGAILAAARELVSGVAVKKAIL